MRLNKVSLRDTAGWKSAKVTLPAFDYDEVCLYTKEHPAWVHFGAGNIFRGFAARLQQKLLNEGLAQSGIVAVEAFDYDIIDKIYTPYDNLTLLVSLNADGNADREIIASVTESLRGDSADKGQIIRLKEIFCNPDLQMVSFTITEKGYAVKGLGGNMLPVVEQDIANGPDKAVHTISLVTMLLLERYRAGAYPLALVSMDNCSHNGDVVKNSVLTIAMAWVERGFADKGFVDYISDDNNVAFPWTMIDKITPRPDEQIRSGLEADGIENMSPVITKGNTFIAPFVNAEVSEYLVIEDKFPNGRPALEKAGVFFTGRDTVNNAERMKVTTCLNPLHTALAVFGCLLGYNRISDEMRDKDLVALVERIGYKEGLPVVVHPGIIEPEDFLSTVLKVRLPNPFIPDMPQRIASDTSQKVAIRFGETIKAYVNDPKRDVMSLVGIPLAIAAWMRYLLAADDDGNTITVSSDPLLNQLQSQLAGITAGKPDSYNGQLKNILSNETLFSVNLCDVGLAGLIETMFVEMLAGKSAVRQTLQKYLAM